MNLLNCTCVDRIAAEGGRHEAICAMSITRTGQIWFKPKGDGWHIAPLAELTALRQQVTDLRAALETLYDDVRAYYYAYPWNESDAVHAAGKVLAATQPQEVQP